MTQLDIAMASVKAEGYCRPSQQDLGASMNMTTH